MEVVERSTADLIPYAMNARTHAPEQVAQIAASIKEFGFNNPILIDEDSGIIAGHGRVMAAQKLNLNQVPTITLAHLTDTQRKAYILADNKLALNAGWDLEALSLELAGLDESEFDLSLIGFDETELANLLADKTEGLTDPDDIPPIPDETTTKPGDIWLLGRHRLRCGDSTAADDVEALTNGQPADLCFTSPPYAQQRDYKSEISDWDALMNGVFSILPVKDGAQVLVNLGMVHDSGKVNSYWNEWLEYMADCGWPLFGWYVWDKGFGKPGDWNGRLAPAHEFVFHFAKSPSRSNKWVDKQEKYIKERSAGRQFRQKDGSLKAATSPQSSLQKTKVADSVIRVTPHMARGIETQGHPAVFPVELCEHIYNSYAKAGDIIYEPFGGAGTSMIACEKFGATCHAMEISPEYCDVAVKRWENFTGETASLEQTND